MKNTLFWKSLGLAVVVAGSALVVSCAPPQQPATPNAPAAVNETGRYQIVVSSEGERGAVLFLVDTKEGATWIYRPPQGPAINGFWSDIPRVTYPPDFWQRAFSMMAQRSATNAPPPGTGTAPAATNAPPR